MAAFVAVTLYATAALAHPRGSVQSRAMLGPLCVGVVMIGVAASFGLAMACGVSFSPVVSSVIFVLLGLGVDDAFVIMAALQAQPRSLPASVRIGGALAIAGGSITLTSFTNLVAFGIGATTVIPALRSFCLFASVAVGVDYALQLTLFLAHVALDEERIDAGRHIMSWYVGPPRCRVPPAATRTQAWR